MTTTRRLAAILAADVVGYSRLIGADEPGTLARLRAVRAAVIDPLLVTHGGRVFKSMGDGLLAEFPSGVQAIECAIAVQQAMGAQGGIQLRIGLHSADVVVQPDGDLLGDGVNVASRLEALAEPGGICLSDRVREDAAGKLSLDLEDLGERELKNITRKMRVFRVRLDEPERPALPLPDKPSIAVLPFQNMSGDPEQEYFADGMVEEIITGLSRVRSFFVIARNSSFAYKGKSPDVRQVGCELGVRYVLEGSVRKAGNRVRITGQLVDATTGAHLWADRFDGALEDIFELQDHVTASVVTAIEPKIRSAEIERAQHKPTENLHAYDLLLRALPHLYSLNRERIEEAAPLLRRATEVDPTCALAFAQLAVSLWVPVMQGWTQGTKAAKTEIVRVARVALEHGAEDPEVLALVSGLIGFPGGDMDGGISLAEKALVLNPNSALALTRAGMLHAYAGNTDKAIGYLERAARLSPLEPGWIRNLASSVAHFVSGRYGAALEFARKSAQANPNFAPAFCYSAASLGLLSRPDEARQAAQQLRTIAPDWTVSRIRANVMVDLNSVFRTPGVLDALCEGLRRAGLPE